MRCRPAGHTDPLGMGYVGCEFATEWENVVLTCPAAGPTQHGARLSTGSTERRNRY